MSVPSAGEQRRGFPHPPRLAGMAFEAITGSAPSFGGADGAVLRLASSVTRHLALGATQAVLPSRHVSPSTEAIDRADKLPIYAREHVSHVWLLDPRVQTLEAFALDSSNYRLLGTWRDNANVRIPPFDALELELGALWAR